MPLLQLVVEVRLDVLAPFGESRQAEAPQVDAREQVLAEAPGRDVGAQVAVRAADELEVALRLLVRAERQEAPLLDRAQEHRLLVRAELADLVEEEQPAVRGLQEPRPVRSRARVGTLAMAEERARRLVAAQRGAVHVDERALELALGLLEIVDAPRELRLARAGRPGEQDRVARAHGDALHRLDERVERRIARLDAALERRDVVPPLRREPPRERVVARKLQVDHAVGPARAAAALRLLPAGRGLHELPRQVVRLVEEEEADLRDVRSGGDVDVPVALLAVEPPRERVVVELAVDLAEVPRIVELHDLGDDHRVRRGRPDVANHAVRQTLELRLVEQVELVEVQVLLHRERHVRPPGVPAVLAPRPVRVQR